MIQNDFFELLYNYMNERFSHNIQAQLKKDSTYQYAIEKETESYQTYENLNLPKEQDKMIQEYIDSIHDTNSLCLLTSSLSHRNAMFFSLLSELSDMK